MNVEKDIRVTRDHLSGSRRDRTLLELHPSDSASEADVRAQPNMADNPRSDPMESVQARRIRRPAVRPAQSQQLAQRANRCQAQSAPGPRRVKRFPSNRCVRFSLDWREQTESRLPID